MKPPAAAPNPWKTGPIRDLQKKRIEAREAKALPGQPKPPSIVAPMGATQTRAKTARL
jgi:hypothetical protein